MRAPPAVHFVPAAAFLAVILTAAVVAAGRADAGAAAAYGIHPLLLAAVHERETQFSTLDAPGVRSGWNGCGAAGPMQFGIVDVPPYRATAPDCGALTGTGAGNTWARYRDARDKVDFPPGTNEDRPPACSEVPPKHGCVYADADAIARSRRVPPRPGRRPRARRPCLASRPALQPRRRLRRRRPRARPRMGSRTEQRPQPRERPDHPRRQSKTRPRRPRPSP